MNHLRFSGWCMIVGGAGLFLSNALFNPFMPSGTSPEVMGSLPFLGRLSFAAVTVFCLMVGATGVHKYQSHQTKWFGAATFGLTFVGSALVFAHEWNQVFVMHTMALAAPDAMLAVDAIPGFNLFAIEGVTAVIAFSLGWILFSMSMLVARVFPWTGPAVVLIGYIGNPLLQVVMNPLFGGIIGTGVIGLGYAMLGLTLVKNSDGAVATGRAQ